MAQFGEPTGTGDSGGSKQVTINLSFNTSNGSYSLSSTNTSLAQISSDKKSYIVKGKTYTPTVSKSSVVNKLYRLNSWTMPAGSTVGTTRPTSSKSGSPNTTSDYTSDEVNYYSSHTSYDYKTLSVVLNSSSGQVSGDTSYCSASTTYEWKAVSAGDHQASESKSCTAGANKSLSGDTKFFNVKWSSFGLSYSGGTYYEPTSATCKTVIDGNTRYTPGNTRATINEVNNFKHIISQTFYLEHKNYSFSSVTWDSTAGTGWSKYGSATTTDTKSSQEYRKSSTTYSPDFYSKFTFDASTGSITWSHRGGSTSYYNKVEDNSTFDIDNLSTTTYTHTSTDWNADDLNVISQSKTSLTIGIATIAWEWYQNGSPYASGDDIEVNGEKVDNFEIQ